MTKNLDYKKNKKKQQQQQKKQKKNPRAIQMDFQSFGGNLPPSVCSLLDQAHVAASHHTNILHLSLPSTPLRL